MPWPRPADDHRFLPHFSLAHGESRRPRRCNCRPARSSTSTRRGSTALPRRSAAGRSRPTWPFSSAPTAAFTAVQRRAALRPPSPSRFSSWWASGNGSACQPPSTTDSTTWPIATDQAHVAELGRPRQCLAGDQSADRPGIPGENAAIDMSTGSWTDPSNWPGLHQHGPQLARDSQGLGGK